jgi:pyrroline-5-carboxylate reductase
MKKTIGCIGSGNIGPALMKGISKIIDPEFIGFSDLHLSRAQAAADSVGGQVYNSNTQAVEQVDYLFLAVKPQVYKSVLEEIRSAVIDRLSAEKKGGKSLTLISVVAGWSIAKIRSCINVDVPIVRIMPNTPALVSRGLIAMSTSPDFPAERITEVETILSGAGLVDNLEEIFMDSVTGLSGSGPAFVYIFIEALADGGVRAGLPRDKALRYAVQTVLGSAHMVQETGKHPGELKDMVTSPGGTTIAGIAALENGAFRGAVINAIEAAWRRSSELFSAAL